MFPGENHGGLHVIIAEDDISYFHKSGSFESISAIANAW